MNTRTFLLALLAQFCVVSTSAVEVVVDGLHYEIDTDSLTASVISDTGFEEGGDWWESYEVKAPSTYSGDIVIPATILVDGVEYQVNRIGENAFYHCEDLLSVDIQAKLKSIEHYAFEECTKLTSIVIPEGVTAILYSAFNGCSALASITFPESLTYVGDYALTSTAWYYQQPEGQLYAGRVLYGFRGTMPENAVVEIRQGTVQICREAFKGRKNLTAVRIPDSVTLMGESVFSGCTGLGECTLPANLKTLPRSTFYDCTSLESVTFPAALTYIEGAVFYRCQSLKTIYCPTDSVPKTNIVSMFSNTDVSKIDLYVNPSLVDEFKAKSPWNLFANIYPFGSFETEKCATPTIVYEQGKLTFASETEGATFVTDIADQDITRHYGNEVRLAVAYTIRVVARRIGYLDSDPATATLYWPTAAPITENGSITVKTEEIQAAPVLVQRQGTLLRIAGAPLGVRLGAYALDGRLINTANAAEHETVLSTQQASGQPVILRIGEKAIKVMP